MNFLVRALLKLNCSRLLRSDNFDKYYFEWFKSLNVNSKFIFMGTQMQSFDNTTVACRTAQFIDYFDKKLRHQRDNY